MIFQRMLLVCGLLFAGLLPTMAQDTLTAEDVIRGRVTRDEYSFVYSFEAEEGDILIFEMIGIEPARDGLAQPELILLGLEREVLVTTEEMFQDLGGYGAAYLGFVAPRTGRYGVIATREDGAEGDEEGDFELRMIRPTVLTADEPLEGSITNDDTHQFYVYTPADVAVRLLYERTEGGYGPEVSVNVLNDDGELVGLAFLFGEQLSSGSLGRFDDPVPHFIVVGEQTQGFSSLGLNTLTADYTLEIQVDEK